MNRSNNSKQSKNHWIIPHFFIKPTDKIESIKGTPEKDVEEVESTAIEKVSDDEELLDDGTEIEYHCPVCSRIFDKVCNGNLALNTRFFLLVEKSKTYEKSEVMHIDLL